MPEEVMGLVTIDSFENTLGAAVNWVLGRFFGQTIEQQLFSDTHSMKRITQWYQQSECLTLLGRCKPIVGDPFSFRPGVMSEAL